MEKFILEPTKKKHLKKKHCFLLAQGAVSDFPTGGPIWPSAKEIIERMQMKLATGIPSSSVGLSMFDL